MKCKIPEIVTEEMAAARHKRNIRANDLHFIFADRLLRISLHENFGYGYKRLSESDSGIHQIGREYIEKYAIDDKDDQEYAIDSYYAMRRDLRDLCGYDPEAELWRDEDFEQFKPDGNSAAIRTMWRGRVEYCQRIGFYVRQMLSMAAVYLHTHRGYATVRINRTLHPVRDEYCEMIRQFLRCSKAGEEAVARMYSDVRNRFNDIGYFEKEYN